MSGPGVSESAMAVLDVLVNQRVQPRGGPYYPGDTRELDAVWEPRPAGEQPHWADRPMRATAAALASAPGLEDLDAEQLLDAMRELAATELAYWSPRAGAATLAPSDAGNELVVHRYRIADAKALVAA